jgi:hypothetical protein
MERAGVRAGFIHLTEANEGNEGGGRREWKGQSQEHGNVLNIYQNPRTDPSISISIDSGPVHVAGAVGTPVVGLFGANAPQFRLPPAGLGVGVVADVPCLYCHHRTPRGHWQTGCPNDIRCMKELAVAPVFQAVKDLLKA